MVIGVRRPNPLPGGVVQLVAPRCSVVRLDIPVAGPIAIVETNGIPAWIGGRVRYGPFPGAIGAEYRAVLQLDLCLHGCDAPCVIGSHGQHVGAVHGRSGQGVLLWRTPIAARPQQAAIEVSRVPIVGRDLDVVQVHGGLANLNVVMARSGLQTRCRNVPQHEHGAGLVGGPQAKNAHIRERRIQSRGGRSAVECQVGAVTCDRGQGAATHRDGTAARGHGTRATATQRDMVCHGDGPFTRGDVAARPCQRLGKRETRICGSHRTQVMRHSGATGSDKRHRIFEGCNPLCLDTACSGGVTQSDRCESITQTTELCRIDVQPCLNWRAGPQIHRT